MYGRAHGPGSPRTPAFRLLRMALVYATRLHRTQSRKGTTIPYVSHLLAVASIVLEHGATEDEAIEARLQHAPIT